MIIGVPKEIKTREYRVGMTPAGVRSLTSRGPQGPRRARRRARAAASATPSTRRRAPRIVPTAADAWGAEMVVKVKEPLPARVRLLPQGPHPLHVPAPRHRARADAGARAARRGRRRVRDHRARGRQPPAPAADERGRRSHGRAGRRDVPREGARRQGRPARRRPGHAARARGHPRRRRRRPQRGDHRGRHGRAGHRARRARRRRWPTSRTSSAAPSRRSTRTPRTSRRWRARAPTCVIGAVLVTGAAAPKLVTEELVGEDEHGQRHRRRRGRPGRLHRDLPADDARPPDLRGARRRPLLRPEHAGRGAADEHLGAHEHDHPLRGARSPTTGSRRPPRPTRAAPRASTRYGGHVTYEPVARAHTLEYVPARDLARAEGRLDVGRSASKAHRRHRRRRHRPRGRSRRPRACSSSTATCAAFRSTCGRSISAPTATSATAPPIPRRCTSASPARRAPSSSARSAIRACRGSSTRATSSSACASGSTSTRTSAPSARSPTASSRSRAAARRTSTSSSSARTPRASTSAWAASSSAARRDEVAINEDVNTRKGVERLIRAGFEYARAPRQEARPHGRQVERDAARARALVPRLLRGGRGVPRDRGAGTSTSTRCASSSCRTRRSSRSSSRATSSATS